MQPTPINIITGTPAVEFFEDLLASFESIEVLAEQIGPVGMSLLVYLVGEISRGGIVEITTETEARAIAPLLAGLEHASRWRTFIRWNVSEESA